MISGKSQSSDIIYLPTEKSLVASYNFNYTHAGIYIGGGFMTSFPTPYVYTTPSFRINRVGISLGGPKINFMGGVNLQSHKMDSLKVRPDLWVKVYPLRIITNTKEGFDFILAGNYMNGWRYGLGVTIPFRGIYR